MESACVDSIQAEYDYVALHFLNTNSPTVNCALGGVASPSKTLIQIYPNPSSGLFQVSGSSGDYAVTVLDLHGRIVLRESNASELDLSRYSSGVYFVKIEQGSEVEVIKLVKH